MKNVITYLKTLWRWGLDSQSSDVSLDCRLTVGSPSVKYRLNLLRLVAISAFLLTIGVGNVWGDTYSWTLPFSTTTNGSRESDESEDATFNIKTSKGADHGGTWTNQTKGYYFNVATGGYFILSIPINSSTTSFELEAEIYAWASKKYAVKNCTITYYTSKLSTPAAVCNGATTTSGCYSVDQTITLTASYKPASDGILYIKIAPDAGNIGFESLSVSTNAAASCSANPTVGTASLNGSISLSSIPLSISSVGGGTDCTLAEYGFVWKAGSTPSASDNKTKIGESSSATSFTGNITGSFSTGVTYYIKGYAINNGPNTTLSSTALTITPRSITFYSNGGSSVSTIYVNSGTAASAPTAPTKTGYNFGGWYTDNGTFASAVNWSSTISENKTYYAKWTAKTTTISFNQNSGTGGQTGTLTATYDAAMPSAPVTCPTRTGYDFGGYYDGSGGTGTQYYTNTGASARNWDKDAATATLYAKWTVKSFTVTWMVNGVAYTTGDPSNSVDFGTHVSKLPTAPTPPCGDKFMGWTTTNIGSVGQATDAGLNLFTTAGGAPTISAEGDVTYYAVFADYDE